MQDYYVDHAFRIGALRESGLMARTVGEVRRVVCASPEYLTLHGRPVLPEDLAPHPCITFTGLGSPDRWDFVSDGLPLSVRVRSRLAVNWAESAIDAGLGVTRVLS